MNLKTINTTNARQDLFNLIEETNKLNEPIKIIGKKGNAYLISEEDYETMIETIYILSNNSLSGAINNGIEIPIDKCLKEDELWLID